MKASTPTKVELAMAVTDLMTALHTAAGAAHYFGHGKSEGDPIENTGQWRVCRRHGCTTMLKIALLHADAITWARENSPPTDTSQ